MRRVWFAFVALALAACGGSSSPTAPQGPQYPQIGGTYSSASFWRISAVSVFSGQSASANCDGNMTISQNGGSFTGTFQMRGDCGLTTGSVTSGTVRTDGGISFGTVVPGADPNAFTALTGCAFISGGSLFNGLVSGRTLDASVSGVVACPNGDRLNITVRAVGSR